MMEIVHKIVQVITITISSVGAFVVIWGVFNSAFDFLSLKFTRHKEPFSEVESIRNYLGGHLLLGLEIFIGADIISSVVSPTWEKVGILATIVGVSVVLSYFLRMELRQSRQ
ncbi:MAG TPA: hypothetical protein DDX85_05780 [Nitrospiraceae bacterium]|nr:hypothetical protein [Nitrospiraceae bacterium]